MYADNTLTPRDATRLCALGTLALGPLQYSALVNAVRHFVSRVMGPSLDLMGNSIELLKYEGLVAPIDGEGMADDATLAITEDGMTELRALLRANMRSASSDLNKLVVTLKFRFLHLLDAKDQRDQADILVEVCENELARLDDLRRHHAGDGGFLVEWLDHDIGELEARLAWLEDFRKKLRDAPGAR
jgi:hypothetical protein